MSVVRPDFGDRMEAMLETALDAVENMSESCSSLHSRPSVAECDRLLIQLEGFRRLVAQVRSELPNHGR